MRKLSRDHHIYDLGPHEPPAYEIHLGEAVIVETWDAFAGRYTEPDGGQSIEGKANPSTGPIAVRGIEPGDTLAVEILGIDPVGTGILRTGALLKKIPIVGNYALFDDMQWRLQPMIGVLGVASAQGEVDGKTPGIYGGNMDTNDVCVGAILHLQAQVAGGLLMMGDVHALMGEGESNGMGIEVGAHITLRAHREENPLTHYPYLLLNGKLIVIASAETLDEAASQAVEEMRRIVVEQLSVDADTARLLVGVLGNVRVSQIVNPLKTVRVDMPLVRCGNRWVLRD